MKMEPASLPCVIFALAREAGPFLKSLSPSSAVKGAPCKASWCGPLHSPILVLQTGVGAQRTSAALEWLFAARSPNCVISAGFAGALDPALAVGDVIIADEVVAADQEAWRVGAGCLSAGRLLTLDRI